MNATPWRDTLDIGPVRYVITDSGRVADMTLTRESDGAPSVTLATGADAWPAWCDVLDTLGHWEITR